MSRLGLPKTTSMISDACLSLVRFRRGYGGDCSSLVQCSTARVSSKRCVVPRPTKSLDYRGRHTSTRVECHTIPVLGYLNTPAILPGNEFQQKKIAALDEMDPIVGQKSPISITSNRGNVTGSYNNMWKNCDIPVLVADKRRAVLEWLSPLEPRERH